MNCVFVFAKYCRPFCLKWVRAGNSGIQLLLHSHRWRESNSRNHKILAWPWNRILCTFYMAWCNGYIASFLLRTQDYFASSSCNLMIWYLPSLSLYWFKLNPNPNDISSTLNPKSLIAKTKPACSQCIMSKQTFWASTIEPASQHDVSFLFFKYSRFPCWLSPFLGSLCIRLMSATCTKLASFQPLKMHIYSAKYIGQ